MYFQCKNQSANGTYRQAWPGQAEITSHTASMVELILYGRGSRMDTVIGNCHTAAAPVS